MAFAVPRWQVVILSKSLIQLLSLPRSAVPLILTLPIHMRIRNFFTITCNAACQRRGMRRDSTTSAHTRHDFSKV